MSKHSIQILTLSESVRKRPKLYGLCLDNDGLHHLVLQIAEYAVNPSKYNASTQLTLTLKQDKDIVFVDNGRGIPIFPLLPYTKRVRIESVLTDFLGRRDTEKPYQQFGFLSDVGSLLNSLADDLQVETIVDGVRYKVRGRMGEITEPLEVVGETSEKGTRIAFLPDYASFEDAEFDRQMLEDGLQQLSEKYPHVAFRLVDNRVGSGEYEND